jgi:hypothetical protein
MSDNLNNFGLVGFQEPKSSANDTNALSFAIKQQIGKMPIATLCKVVAVTNNGEVKGTGTLSIQPMVHQMDGSGKTTPHGVIHNVPYHRQGGGKDAIIADPKVGDIGIVTFASRDISTVKKNRDVAGPASWRRNDWGDAMYHGQTLNVTPTQYIQFTDDGINIYSPGTVTVTAKNEAGITLNAPKIVLTADIEIDLTAPQINLSASQQSKATGPLFSVNVTQEIDLTAPAINLNQGG